LGSSQATQNPILYGAAFGDVDNDGGPDVLVANDSGPVWRMLNHVGSRHPWLGLCLLDKAGRNAQGARVFLPSGRVEDWSGLAARRYTALREDAGKASPDSHD